MIRKVKLGEVLDVTRGTSLPGNFYATEGKYLRLTLGNFKYPNGGFKYNTAKKDLYFTGKINKAYVLHKGDIITPLTEQVEGLLGETAFIPEDDKFIQSGDIGLIIPNKEKLNNLYCYYLISSDFIKKQLGAGAQQTKIRHTSPEKIKSVVAFVPELSKQEKIGNLLYSMDKQITKNNYMVQKLPFFNHLNFSSKGGE